MKRYNVLLILMIIISVVLINADVVTEVVETPPKYFWNVSEYLPINESIIPVDVSLGINDYVYGVEAGVYKAYFKERSTQLTPGQRPVAVINEDYIVMLTPSQVSPYMTWDLDCDTSALPRVAAKKASDLEVNGSVATYPGQYKQYQRTADFANLTYEYFADKLKATVILWDRSWLQTRYDACYNLPHNVSLQYHTDIKAFYQEDIGNQSLGVSIGKLNPSSFKEFGLYSDSEINTSDEIHFTDSQNSTVFFIPVLYAWDSNSSKIIINKTISMTAAGNLRVAVLTPYSWLNDTSTVYPVYIDPTLKINRTIEINYSIPSPLTCEFNCTTMINVTATGSFCVNVSASRMNDVTLDDLNDKYALNTAMREIRILEDINGTLVSMDEWCFEAGEVRSIYVNGYKNKPWESFNMSLVFFNASLNVVWNPLYDSSAYEKTIALINTTCKTTTGVYTYPTHNITCPAEVDCDEYVEDNLNHTYYRENYLNRYGVWNYTHLKILDYVVDTYENCSEYYKKYVLK